jgi:hypothetical protein
VQIVKIHLLLEFPNDEAFIKAQVEDPCSKLKFYPLSRRLHYKDIFAYANTHLQGKVCCYLNGDISFGSGLSALDVNKHMLNGSRVLALSRHEEIESNICGKNLCYRYENSNEGFLSSDAFIFLAPVPEVLINTTDFQPQSGSENVVIKVLKDAGFDVRNPCR